MRKQNAEMTVTSLRYLLEAIITAFFCLRYGLASTISILVMPKQAEVMSGNFALVLLLVHLVISIYIERIYNKQEA